MRKTSVEESMCGVETGVVWERDRCGVDGDRCVGAIQDQRERERER